MVWWILQPAKQWLSITASIYNANSLMLTKILLLTIEDLCILSIPAVNPNGK